MLQKFRMDIIITWCCGWFCCEWGRKTLVSCLLQQSLALVVNLAFEFLVMWCLCYMDIHL